MNTENTTCEVWSKQETIKFIIKFRSCKKCESSINFGIFGGSPEFFPNIKLSDMQEYMFSYVSQNRSGRIYYSHAFEYWQFFTLFLKYYTSFFATYRTGRINHKGRKERTIYMQRRSYRVGRYRDRDYTPSSPRK